MIILGQKHHCTIVTMARTTNALDPRRYNLLCEFAIRHTAFHRAELESVLSLWNIVIGRDCEVVELPSNPDHHDAAAAAAPLPLSKVDNEAGDTKGANVHQGAPVEVSKKRPRDDADSKGGAPSGSTPPHHAANTKQASRSFLILTFPRSALGTQFRHDIYACNNNNEDQSRKNLPDIKEMLSRCVLIRSVVELWGAGISIEECASSVQSYAANATNATNIAKHHQSTDRSWKITVHTLGSKYNRDEQNAMRDHFAFLNYGGTVQMNAPDDEYIFIREMSLNTKGGPLYPRLSEVKELIPENDRRPPLAAYFGRILGGERNWRSDLERYSLKKRVYLGPTSMDAELSLVMTNLARVTSQSLAFDPFVGTGSILLSCGLRGARCVGTDIDLRVLRGEGKKEDVFSNFRQYKLARPELIRSDNSLYHRHYRSHEPLYDAIVTDPPYGIRAGARKSGSRREEVRAVREEHRGDHIAQTRPYAVSDVMADLLDVSARTLAMGGRLVYVIPSMTDFDEATDLPRHECLRLLYTCFQPLQHPELGRRTVTMEKVAEYDETKREEYVAKVWVNGPESAEKCANIRDRIVEAAKLKPGYEEKAAIRREKRRATKEARKKAKRDASGDGAE